ncbi:MAG: type VI secretion system-associated protein [Geobacteraceae bacterium GWC2_58_44]|nr:MAG: type VI secretion system-associated protein [Geobacteraceae bacterium GWC2_58_44]HBG06209.1 type VI secretion system baseplate subunit TssK [Geobacter sp.]
MNVPRPLFWKQGIQLQPQHFQLLDRNCRGLLSPYQKYLQPHFWGIAAMALRKSALGTGSFSLLEGEFLFPDGTFVSISENGRIDARAFDEAWLEGGKPFTVYLGLKKWRDSGENVTVLPTLETVSSASTRFVTTTEHEEVNDLHAGGAVSPVNRLHYALKICWESEQDQLGEYELIPLAQLERVGAEIRLSEEYIPPCLCFSASPSLQRLISEIRDQVTARGYQLEEHKRKRGIHTAEFGSRDMVYFLALRSVNRYLPLLFHYTGTERIHPWHIYGILRQLIGELTGFSERIGVLGELQDGRKLLPEYDHRNLWSCFSAAQNLISRLLDEITAGPEYVIGLAYDGTFYGADLKPAIFEGRNRFYLAVKTEEDPKNVLRALEEMAKLSTPEHLKLLVSRSLPGIGLQYLQIPPQELPRRANTVYFAIDHHDDQWSAVAKNHSLALYWNGAPADIEIELMAVGR